MKNNKIKEILKDKMKYIKISVIAVAIILVLGISYAVFNMIKLSDKNNVIKVGALSLVLDDNATNGISLLNATTMSMEDAFNDPSIYTFKIINNGDYDVDYSINLEEKSIVSDKCRIPQDGGDPIETNCERLESSYVYYLLKDITTDENFKLENVGDGDVIKNYLDGTTKTTNNGLNSYTLMTGSLPKTTEKKFSLKLFMPEKSSNNSDITYEDVKGKEFSAKLNIVASQNVSSTTGLQYPISAKVGDNVIALLDKSGTLKITGSGRMYNYYCEPSSSHSCDNTATELVGFYGELLKNAYNNTKYEEYAKYVYSDNSTPYLNILIDLTVCLDSEYVTFDQRFNEILSELEQDKMSSYSDWKFGDKTPTEIMEIVNNMIALMPKYSSIVFDDNITFISAGFGYGTSDILILKLPNELNELEDYAFTYSNISSVNFPDKLIKIGTEAFGWTKLTNLTIDGSVTEIGDYAFENCHELESLIIGDSVVSIGDFAFDNLPKLSYLKIIGNKTFLSFRSFRHLPNLTEENIVLENTNVTLGEIFR